MEIINTKQLCEWLKISSNTAYNWRKNEGLPYTQLTKRTIQYDKEEVEKWLKNRNKAMVDPKDIALKETMDKLKINLQGNFIEKSIDDKLSLYDQLLQFGHEFTILDKQELLKYMEQRNIKVDEYRSLGEWVKKLNDEEFYSVMINALTEQDKNIRLDQLSSIILEFIGVIQDFRNKFIEYKTLEELQDAADYMSSDVFKFLNKLIIITVKLTNEDINKIPTNMDIKELLEIVKTKH